ncbi:DUF6064 family protein [Hansschlegelia sp. KR7-227]|uniref:DUF6064 family protein n=1 Tax=Hansschlegelia sp. KR7-227 TaxID=3400914 RepID=UPI003C0583B7
MSEWWTYAPSDFLMFSPRVYWRLVAAHNAALWPLPPLFVALGAALTGAMLLRPSPTTARAGLAAAGIAMLFVAWSFLWARYASINWAIAYAAPLYGAGGGALLFGAAFARRRGPEPTDRLRTALGGALLILALAYPGVALAAGRGLTSSEAVGVTADPTAIAALGVVALVGGSRRRLTLATIPLAWCLFSAMTLWTMGAPDAFALLAAALAGLAAVTRR